jgi:transcriptional regulator with XRE-family HTH domain
MKLGDRLFSLRKERGITLKDACAKGNCSYQNLQKLEKGKITRPKLTLLYNLAAFYQFPSDTLILEAGKIPEDVYFKLLRCPSLLKVIRNHPEK